MPKIAVVTDSTANIPLQYLEQYKITSAPQVLIWGNETYRDGVDIQPQEFYSRLKTAKVMPSTSQVTPKTFIDIFGQLVEEGNQVLAILISANLSGTMASAIQALETMKGAPVELVDSDTTSMAMGFQVLAAARAAAQGASLEECRKLAEKARSHVGVVFTVETLEFLHRGGRIGGGARLLGTALNIKPILEIEKGRVEAVERVRTRKKSLARLVELVQQRVAGRQPVRLSAIHANAEAEATELLEMCKDVLDPVETIVAAVSPVIGTHAGPGTVGMAFMAGLD